MALTARERELLALIEQSPLATPEELARKVGSTRAAVNVHVSNLVKKGALLGRGYIVAPRHDGGHVVVVGGANVDLKVRTTGPAIAQTSNPGQASRSAGGVGRNIAENLSRLGVSTTLVSVVGTDDLGDSLLRDTGEAGVDLRHVTRVPGAATGTYTAVLDDAGDLVVAVADMGVIEALDDQLVRRHERAFHGAAWVVADGNLTSAALATVLEVAAGRGSRVIVEPVSVPKAGRLRGLLTAGNPPYAVTPNIGELAELVGEHVDNEPSAIGAAAAALHRQGIPLVWVRRGALGSALSVDDDNGIEFDCLPSIPARVVDVTGAGDAMLGAFIAGLVNGSTPLQAARLGHAAAALTIETAATVRPDLTFDAVAARLPAVRKPDRPHHREEVHA